ncbi:MAG: UvrD-helicase domain-containing protein, partial [Planctomycetota bacterium]|nr:UvrD-helicase domain-containing protein [Planctomycetota bacterium]
MSDCEHELLNGLTDAQVDAVTTTEGPLLVLAGPGSGKTTVVTRRIAWLLAQGIPSWQLLALTFTNKAAGEMRDRVDALLPGVSGERRGLTIMTFHGFCARLLRQYPDEARVPSNYSIYDTTDRRAALKQAVRNAGLDSGNWTPASVGEAISQCKNRLTTAEQHDAGGGDFYTRSIGRIYREYQTILDRNGALDFDDLLLKVAVMLRDDDEMRQTLQDRFRYLMIDEYQDTNQAQFVIASALVGPQRNICVVGDPDQSIYGWRGADISNILDFEHQFSAAKVVSLGRNFRSTGHIVEASAGLIRRNSSHRERTLHTELGDGDRVVVAGAADEHDEARQLVDLFRDQFMAGTPWREMAVLYRINALSRVLEQAFRDGQIPYVVARGTAFYERAEIKDALSYLRLVVNPRDEVALRRIINTPPRGIGKTSLDRVEKHAILNR